MAFATATDLAGRLGRAVWTGVELAQVNFLLDDATEHLRAIIGWQVSPPATVTASVDEGGQLPGSPVTAVTSVSVNDVLVSAGSYVLQDGEIHWLRSFWGPARVTYTVGYVLPPPDLVSWTCVLASQALTAVGELDSLGGGGVSSLAIGDYRKSWAEGGEGAGFALPARVEEKLRARYGSGVFVTGCR